VFGVVGVEHRVRQDRVVTQQGFGRLAAGGNAGVQCCDIPFAPKISLSRAAMSAAVVFSSMEMPSKP
jgi:hypothetical protein